MSRHKLLQLLKQQSRVRRLRPTTSKNSRRRSRQHWRLKHRCVPSKHSRLKLSRRSRLKQPKPNKLKPPNKRHNKRPHSRRRSKQPRSKRHSKQQRKQHKPCRHLPRLSKQCSKRHNRLPPSKQRKRQVFHWAIWAACLWAAFHWLVWIRPMPKRKRRRLWTHKRHWMRIMQQVLQSCRHRRRHMHRHKFRQQKLLPGLPRNRHKPWPRHSSVPWSRHKLRLLRSKQGCSSNSSSNRGNRPLLRRSNAVRRS